MARALVMLLLMERQALALQLVISGCGRCGASIWRRSHTSKSSSAKVVTGVFCNTAIESAHADKEVAAIKQVRSKDQQVEALRQVFSEIDNANRNLVTFEEMADAISNGELASFMEAMGISTDDIRTLYTLLDADKDGLIDLDEFVSGCMQLHGPAKSLQLAKMSFENKLARDDLKTLTKDFADFKSLLQVKQMVRSQNQKEMKESF